MQKIGEFFSVSLQTIRKIANFHLQNASVEPPSFATFAAYIVLCRGAGRGCTTAWAAHGIHKHTGLTLRVAEQALVWLTRNGFIENLSTIEKASECSEKVNAEADVISATEAEPALETQTGKHVYRINRYQTEERIFLPNSLVDARNGHKCGPLGRILANCTASYRPGPIIELHDARIDAILLLLQLYGEHSLDIYGGVNPDLWHATWTYSQRKDDFEQSSAASSVGDDVFDFFSAKASREIFDPSSICEMFEYIEDTDEVAHRLEHALKNLRAMRFLYQVVQVWGKKTNSRLGYTLRYPLHIFDRAQRDQDEPAVGPEIHDIVIKCRNAIGGVKAEYERIENANSRATNAGYSSVHTDGVFFLTRREISHILRTSLRLRYRAHDPDTNAGMAEQICMAKTWHDNLKTVSVCVTAERNSSTE